jgi:hypothetical protein
VATRQGYARLDPNNAAELLLLLGIYAKHDVPEITMRCWAILNKDPGDIRRYDVRLKPDGR